MTYLLLFPILTLISSNFLYLPEPQHSLHYSLCTFKEKDSNKRNPTHPSFHHTWTVSNAISSYDTSKPYIPVAAMFPSCPPHHAFQLSMPSSSQVRKPLSWMYRKIGQNFRGTITEERTTYSLNYWGKINHVKKKR